MRTISKFGLVALVAAITVLPTFNSPASARTTFLRRTLQRVYTPTYNYANPYGYGYYSQYQANQAAADSFVNQVNAMVQSGQLTLSEGNAILVRGHF
jgi:hypothetical protein